MKKFKTIIFTFATAITISACNNSEKNNATTADSITQKTDQTTNKVDIDQAMEGMPKFSSPEIQKTAEEWFAVFSDGMKEAQQQASLANGDQAKMKEIAKEMGSKFEPWKPKLAKLQADMTVEDRKLFDDYGNKISNSIVAQAKQN